MRNWKTTLAGFAGAVLELVANGMSLKTALVAAAWALLGAAARDHNNHATADGPPR